MDFIEGELSLGHFEHHECIIVAVFEVFVLEDGVREFDVVPVVVHDAELVVRLVFDINGLHWGQGGGIQAETYFVHDVFDSNRWGYLARGITIS